jgi:hypothetical protein
MYLVDLVTLVTRAIAAVASRASWVETSKGGLVLDVGPDSQGVIIGRTTAARTSHMVTYRNRSLCFSILWLAPEGGCYCCFEQTAAFDGNYASYRAPVGFCPSLVSICCCL